MKCITIFIGAAAILLSACSNTSSLVHKKPSKLQVPINHALFTQQEIQSEVSVFELPEEERKQFLDYASHYLYKGMRADKIILNYLENELSNFKYHGATLSSEQTLSQQQGNCISLAVLTQSYANALNLDTSFQAVSSQPIYAQENGLVYISHHFRTKIYAPTQDIHSDGTIEILRAGTLIDYFPSMGSFFSGNANYNDLVAKYYSNLAAKALAQQDLDLAYSLILQVQKFTPNDPELFNIAGILHRRAGDLQGAKAIYQSALDNDLYSINLLSNYRALAKDLGDIALAEQLTAALGGEDKDPFDLLMLAKNVAHSGKLNTAVQYIEEAIAQAPYISELYLELAKIKYQQGRNKQTETLLEQAIERQRNEEKRDIYQAKLLSLQSKT